MRRLLYGASAAVITWAAVTVPLPLIEVAPGGAPSVAPLLDVATDTTAINGDLRLLTVITRQPTVLEVGRALLDDAHDLEPLDRFRSPLLDRDDQLRLQSLQFRRSAEIAAAVGLRLAGETVPVTTGALVTAVVPGAPAEDLLHPGDVVTALGGEVVDGADALRVLTQRSSPGDPLRLTVHRGDEVREVTVVAGQAAGMARPGLGVTVDTALATVELPFDVGLTDGIRIGGPSAGMMLALTVYDLVSEVDLAAGRIVAGTGTVMLDGTVGRVGGIEEKVLAAEREGATVLLVPRSQVVEARNAAPPTMQVIGVATVAEAVEKLGAA